MIETLNKSLLAIPVHGKISPVEVTQDIVYGPHVRELSYAEGGMTSLLEEAALGKDGAIILQSSDLDNPNRITKIHYPLRDILIRGDSIKLFGRGKIETIPLEQNIQLPLPWKERTLYNAAD